MTKWAKFRTTVERAEQDIKWEDKTLQNRKNKEAAGFKPTTGLYLSLVVILRPTPPENSDLELEE